MLVAYCAGMAYVGICASKPLPGPTTGYGAKPFENISVHWPFVPLAAPGMPDG